MLSWLNRRVPNGTHGGVRGRRSNDRLLLDYSGGSSYLKQPCPLADFPAGEKMSLHGPLQGGGLREGLKGKFVPVLIADLEAPAVPGAGFGIEGDRIEEALERADMRTLGEASQAPATAARSSTSIYNRSIPGDGCLHMRGRRRRRCGCSPP